MKKNKFPFWPIWIWLVNTLIWIAVALINRLYDHVGKTTPGWAVWLYLLCAAMSLSAAIFAYVQYQKSKDKDNN